MAENQIYVTPDTIAKQVVKSLYCDVGDQELREYLDVHCIGYEWILVKRQQNSTSSTNFMTITYQTALKVTNGTENEANFGIGGAFKGLSMNIGGSTKTFTSQETSNTTTVSYIIQLAPNTTTFFLPETPQLKPIGLFVLDASGQFWTVGSKGGYKVSWIQETI